MSAHWYAVYCTMYTTWWVLIKQYWQGIQSTLVCMLRSIYTDSIVVMVTGVQWASGSEWWRQQNKITRHLRRWLLATSEPSFPCILDEETGDNWWHKVDLVVPVRLLPFGLLPVAYFRPNGVCLLFKIWMTQNHAEWVNHKRITSQVISGIVISVLDIFMWQVCIIPYPIFLGIPATGYV